ncbi:MAG: zinc-binding dehydrogenase [Pseudobdellovibrionaceae bacterium]
MRALVYSLSVPKYLASKFYFSFLKGTRPFFPNLKFSKAAEKPALPNEQWVELKSLMSGICGSDQNMLRGQEAFSMEPYASFPCILGHENVAEIVKIGSGVLNWKIGDRVVVNPVMSCVVHGRTLCKFCALGRISLCEGFADSKNGLGPGLSLGYHNKTGGGWGENFVAHQSQLFKIDSAVPLQRAVLTDPFACTLQPVCDFAAGKREEKTVVVFGMGTMGLLLIASIRALRLPWKIIAIYKHEFQGALAKSFGANEILQSSKSLISDFAQMTQAQVLPVALGLPPIEGGVDAVFDCVSSPRSIDLSLRFAKQHGKVFVVGTGTSLAGVDPTPLWFREISLVGSSMSSIVVDPRDGFTKSTYSVAVGLLAELPSLGIRIENLVTHEFKIDDYKKALSVAMGKSQHQAVKVVFAH